MGRSTLSSSEGTGANRRTTRTGAVPGPRKARRGTGSRTDMLGTCEGRKRPCRDVDRAWASRAGHAGLAMQAASRARTLRTGRGRAGHCAHSAGALRVRRDASRAPRATPGCAEGTARALGAPHVRRDSAHRAGPRWPPRDAGPSRLDTPRCRGQGRELGLRGRREGGQEGPTSTAAIAPGSAGASRWERRGSGGAGGWWLREASLDAGEDGALGSAAAARGVAAGRERQFFVGGMTRGART
jgi:hypothetical protein